MAIIKGYCKRVASYNIVQIQYVQSVTSMRYVGFIIHDDTNFTRMKFRVINGKRWTKCKHFRAIEGFKNSII